MNVIKYISSCSSCLCSVLYYFFLHFFSESNVFGVPWKMLTPLDWSPLVNTTRLGEFKVKYDGMYLVFINVRI